MVIDIHTHTFPDKIAARTIETLSRTSKSVAFTDGTTNSLSDSMKKSGVDVSVVLPVATRPEQVEKINDFAARTNEKFFERGIFSLGCIHPDFTNFKTELSRIKNLGLKGIKIHPVYQATDLDDKKFLRIFYRAAELDLIVITHAGLDIGFPGVVRCSPEMSRNVVETIGDFKFVLAHMGGWKNWDAVQKILAGTNVYLDTAFSFGKIIPRPDCVWQPAELEMLNEKNFLDLCKIFGFDKILFGTDSPWSSQKDSVEFVKNLPIPEEDAKKILGENALNLFGGKFL